MDTSAASLVIDEWLAPFRAESHDALAARIGGPVVTADVTRNDRRYQLELECHWDDRPGGNIRVIASIDDGGLRAFVPMTRSFIKAPDGTFVGE